MATHYLARSFEFYTSLGFELYDGGPDTTFTSFVIGAGYLNVIVQPAGRHWSWWGRLSSTSPMWMPSTSWPSRAGLSPEAPPRDAKWGERYFHLADPEGHELSFSIPSGIR